MTAYASFPAYISIQNPNESAVNAKVTFNRRLQDNHIRIKSNR